MISRVSRARNDGSDPRYGSLVVQSQAQAIRPIAKDLLGYLP